MKAIGIVRRIDELGRVVIPKEMRRMMNIKEGEELEIFTREGEEVIIRKYSTLGNLGATGESYCKIIAGHTQKQVLITDMHNVVNSSADKSSVKGAALTRTFVKLMEKRCAAELSPDDAMQIVEGTEYIRYAYVMPIVYAGDVYGSVVILSQESIDNCAVGMAKMAGEMITAMLS